MYGEYGIIIIGILLICFSFWINATGGLVSKVVFNMFPFFSGVYLCLVGATMFGWIVVGK